MTISNHFKKKLLTCSASGCFVLALASCTTMPEQNASTSLAKAAAPVQMQLPGGDQAATPSGQFEGIVNTVSNSAVVISPVAQYLSDGESPNITYVERPKPAKKKKYGRGNGFPAPGYGVQATGKSAVVGETPTPNSWTGTASAFDAGGFDENATQNMGSVFIPPDIHAAAGPEHLVNVVNTFIEFYSKDGTRVFVDSLQDFFAAETPVNATFDPKVIYDQYAERFVVVTLEVVDTPMTKTSRILLAVSDDSDPNGTWYTTSIDALTNISMEDRWADYPGFAVDEEAVYITNNMFGFTSAPGTGAFGGVRLWVVDKGETGGFYDNAGAAVSVFDPYAGGGVATTSQPAHVFDTPAAMAAGTYLVSYGGLTNGTNEFLQTVRIDDPLTMAPTFTQSFIDLGDLEANPLPALPDGPQMGTTDTVETNDRRALNAVWRDNQLWMVSTLLPGAGADMGQTTAYWWQLNADGVAVPTIADQGGIGGEGLDAVNPVATFFPSVGVNSMGEATIGFSAASLGMFPGAYFATREPGDAAGTFSAAQTVRAGTDFYHRTFGGGSNRWGDYSGMAVDPVNECFWAYNQYADTRATMNPPPGTEDGRWGTAYARTCACDLDHVLTGMRWNLFGVACFPGQNTPASLFPSLNSGDYGPGGTWVVYKRDMLAYAVVGINEILQPGIAYWFFNNGGDVTLNGEGAANDAVDVPLVNAAGYENMVSMLHMSDVDSADLVVVDGMTDRTFADAVAMNLVNNTMHSYSPAAQDYESFTGTTPLNRAISPFEGFWIQATADNQSLRVPKPAGGMGPVTGQPEALKKRKNKKKSADQFKEWVVRVVIEADDRVNRSSYFGQNNASQDGVDLNDMKTLAPFGDSYFRAVYPKNKWSDKSGDYASDIRAVTKKPKGKWNLVVKASPGTDKVKLTLEGPAEILSKIKIKDKAKKGKKKVDFSNGYTFSMDGKTERHFVIKVKK